VLRAAHTAGIVHRDLKLDNVFWCDMPFADGRRVKLLDWGVAYVDGEEDPFRGQIAGTLTYVAPEQIRGDSLTGAADIYSLAVLAYHLLCRRPPFAGNDLALLNMHLRAEPPPPRFAWPDVPPALDDLLVRMLAKQPEDRPSLDDVQTTLRAAFALVDHPPHRIRGAARLGGAEACDQPARLADGSNPSIQLSADEPWYLRWLMVSPREVHGDVLGRPMVAPPFRAAWMAVGLTLSAIAALVSALP